MTRGCAIQRESRARSGYSTSVARLLGDEGKVPRRAASPRHVSVARTSIVVRRASVSADVTRPSASSAMRRMTRASSWGDVSAQGSKQQRNAGNCSRRAASTGRVRSPWPASGVVMALSKTGPRSSGRITSARGEPQSRRALASSGLRGELNAALDSPAVSVGVDCAAAPADGVAAMGAAGPKKAEAVGVPARGSRP